MTAHRYFTAAEIQSAHFCPPPSFASRRSPKKGRKAEGLRFEAKAQKALCAESDLYLPGPWIIFIAGGRPFWCQPDGLHFDVQRGVITIIEIKHSHTAEAHRQLRGTYEPVIRCMFPRPSWGVRLVELVHWFDPDIRFPEPIHLCPEPFAHSGPLIGVHVWRS